MFHLVAPSRRTVLVYNLVSDGCCAVCIIIGCLMHVAVIVQRLGGFFEPAVLSLQHGSCMHSSQPAVKRPPLLLMLLLLGCSCTVLQSVGRVSIAAVGVAGGRVLMASAFVCSVVICTGCTLCCSPCRCGCSVGHAAAWAAGILNQHTERWLTGKLVAASFIVVHILYQRKEPLQFCVVHILNQLTQPWLTGERVCLMTPCCWCIHESCTLGRFAVAPVAASCSCGERRLMLCAT